MEWTPPASLRRLGWRKPALVTPGGSVELSSGWTCLSTAKCLTIDSPTAPLRCSQAVGRALLTGEQRRTNYASHRRLSWDSLRPMAQMAQGDNSTPL